MMKIYRYIILLLLLCGVVFASFFLWNLFSDDNRGESEKKSPSIDVSDELLSYNEEGIVAGENFKKYRDSFGRVIMNGDCEKALSDLRVDFSADKNRINKTTESNIRLIQAILSVCEDDLASGLEGFSRIYLSKAENRASIRSVALSRMAELNIIANENLMKEKVFLNESGDGFNQSNFPELNSLYVENDFWKTSKNIANEAEDIFPSAPALFGSLFFDIEASEEVLSDVDREAFVKKISEKSKYAEKVFDDVDFEVSIYGWDPDRLLICYLYKAKINDRLKGQGMEIENSLSNDGIEDLFKKAMELTENPFVAQMPARYEHFVRFYYATFLSNAYGMAREGDIKSLLEPIYAMSGNEEQGIFVFLQKEKNYNDNLPHKKEILGLAKIDPKMNEMLLAAGWELE